MFRRFEFVPLFVPLCSASVKGAPVRRPQAASPSDRHSAPWRWGNNRPKPLCAFGLPKSMSRGSPDAAEGWGKLKVHTKTSLRSFLYGHFSFVFAFIHTKPFFSGFMYGQKRLSKTGRALFPQNVHTKPAREASLYGYLCERQLCAGAITTLLCCHVFGGSNYHIGFTVCYYLSLCFNHKGE